MTKVSQSKKKIVHISTVHNRFDTRILYNQCVSLAKHYDVSLLVCDGKEDCVNDGVKIRSINHFSSKYTRLLYSLFFIHFKLLRTKFDVYHLHDPELFPLALVLKIFGRRVIMDLHEDYEEDIILKKWISKPLRYLSVGLYKLLARIVLPRCDKVITVTNGIGQKSGADYSLVLNYPNALRLVDEHSTFIKKYDFVYVGSISVERGVEQIISLTNIVGAKTLFVGPFADQTSRDYFINDRHDNIECAGFVMPEDVHNYACEAKIGVHLISNNINLLNGIPLKILEYVAMGLPVLCSDSQKWRETFDALTTIIYVDPLDEQALVKGYEACCAFTKEELRESQKKIVSHYSWETQANILRAAYDDVLANG